MNLLWFAMISLYASAGNVHSRHRNHYDSNNNDWDLLVFSQNWRTTLCEKLTHQSTQSCNTPTKPDSWAIHGIWPNRYHDGYPQNCNRSWHFDPEKMTPIESQLMENWSSIRKHDDYFWAHEWAKHGTCAAELEPLDSEFKYFSMGLKWLKKYEAGPILAKHDITPDDHKQYPFMDIYLAIKKTLGVNPDIRCWWNEGTNYLEEIRICFDKNLELCNCDVITWAKKVFNVLTNCDMTRDIFYPQHI